MDAFLSAWRAFPAGFASALAVAGLCGIVGIPLLLRRTVFLALALSQMATLGIALSLLARARLPGHEHLHTAHPWFHCLAEPSFMSLAAVLFGMVLVWSLRGRGSLPDEAWLGGMAALASALSVLAVAESPYGLDEVKNLLFADFLLVRSDGFVTLALLATGVGGTLLAFRRRFLLAAFDADQALAVGVPPRCWLLGLDLLTALTIALTIRAGGSLVVFGLLVLPSLGVLASARRMRGIWIWSPAIGVIGTCLGITASMAWDWPAGPAIVAAVALASCAAGLVRSKLFS